MICTYCNKEAIWCENKEIYWRNYGKSYMCYYCKDCDAYVWCHNNSKKPLWTIANKELRQLRKKAHRLFDPLWKEWTMSRGKAYRILDKEFWKEIHIGESDNDMCKNIINFLKKKFYD